MKYKFIAPIHCLKISNLNNTMYHKGLTISTSKKILKETIMKNPLYETMGEHSRLELIDYEEEVNPYAYLEGEFEGIRTYHDFIDISTIVIFKMLREIQHVIYNLWYIRDNSAYIRDGFLLLYDTIEEDEYINGRTYKGSLSEMPSKSNGVNEVVVFSKGDIREAFDFRLDADENSEAEANFSDANWLDITEKERSLFGGKDIDPDFFSKSNALNRVERSLFFTLSAHYTSHLPIKILNYISAFECLFSTDNSELSHQVSERGALQMGATVDERGEIYETLKSAYKFRSKVVHGQANFRENEIQKISELAVELDEFLRQILSSPTEVFKKSNEELRKHFETLVWESAK